MQRGPSSILALALTASALVFVLAGCSSTSSYGPGQTGNRQGGGGTMMNRGTTTNPNGSGRGSMMTTNGTNP